MTASCLAVELKSSKLSGSCVHEDTPATQTLPRLLVGAFFFARLLPCFASASSHPLRFLCRRRVRSGLVGVVERRGVLVQAAGSLVLGQRGVLGGVEAAAGSPTPTCPNSSAARRATSSASAPRASWAGPAGPAPAAACGCRCMLSCKARTSQDHFAAA